MNAGDGVRSLVALPGIPQGSTGIVKEAGRLFIVVEFADGRLGYYAPRQLSPLKPRSGGADDAPSPTSDLGFTSRTVVQGSHLCLVPGSRHEVIPTVSQYVVAGLRAGEQCIGAASARWAASLRKALSQLWAHTDEAISSGTLTFIDPRDAYRPGEDFTAGTQLRRTEAFITASEAKVMRAFGVISTVVRECPADEWWEYERHATALLRDLGLTALCVYAPAGRRSRCWRQAYATHAWMVRGGELTPGGVPPIT